MIGSPKAIGRDRKEAKQKVATISGGLFLAGVTGNDLIRLISMAINGKLVGGECEERIQICGAICGYVGDGDCGGDGWPICSLGTRRGISYD